MAVPRKVTPDFFDENPIDPVEAATGYAKSNQNTDSKQPSAGLTDQSKKAKKETLVSTVKKKAGFYLSTEILDRFTLKFYELKLGGVAIENKSALLELALSFALDDMDKGAESRVLQKIGS